MSPRRSSSTMPRRPTSPRAACRLARADSSDARSVSIEAIKSDLTAGCQGAAVPAHDGANVGTLVHDRPIRPRLSPGVAHPGRRLWSGFGPIERRSWRRMRRRSSSCVHPGCRLHSSPTPRLRFEQRRCCAADLSAVPSDAHGDRPWAHRHPPKELREAQSIRCRGQRSRRCCAAARRLRQRQQLPVIRRSAQAVRPPVSPGSNVAASRP